MALSYSWTRSFSSGAAAAFSPAAGGVPPLSGGVPLSWTPARGASTRQAAASDSRRREMSIGRLRQREVEADRILAATPRHHTGTAPAHFRRGARRDTTAGRHDEPGH